MTRFLAKFWMHEAARALGFRTGVVAPADVDWQKLPPPATRKQLTLTISSARTSPSVLTGSFPNG
ncbi:MAG TPA: hypothetical protein DHV85_12710 [Candidatus Accumulibacter sp.]|nr:hypothetical protein [Accumulibacter sp.]